MYFKNGRVKIAIALAKGKKTYRQARDDQTARGRARDACGHQDAPSIIARMKRSARLLVGGLVIVVVVARLVSVPIAARQTTSRSISSRNSRPPKPSARRLTSSRSSTPASRASAIRPSTPSEPSRVGLEHHRAGERLAQGEPRHCKRRAWTMQGDGVLFMIGVSDGPIASDLFRLVVNPFGNPSDTAVERDRRWTCRQFAGETVDLIFNTRSEPGAGAGSAAEGRSQRRYGALGRSAHRHPLDGRVA